MIRFPTPPLQYNQAWMNQLCGELERQLRTFQPGSEQSFGNITAASIKTVSLLINGLPAVTAVTGLAPLFTASISGTGALSFAQVSQAAKLFFASPTGGAGNPLMRAIVLADLPLQTADFRFANTNITSNTVANTTVQTAFASSFTIAANSLTIGSVVRVRATGVFGTAAAAPTLIIRVLAGGVVVLASGAITMPISLTGAGWELDVDMVVWGPLGAGALWDAGGMLVFGNVAANAKGADIVMLNSAAVNVATVVGLPITIDAKWSVANAANTITLRRMVGEVLTA